MFRGSPCPTPATSPRWNVRPKLLAYCCNEYRPPDVDRRRELLDALVKVFTERGIGGRSLREIAEAVSTSHRMLLHHFGSRSELLPDAVDDWLADADAVTGGTIDSAFSRLGLAVIRGYCWTWLPPTTT